MKKSKRVLLIVFIVILVLTMVAVFVIRDNKKAKEDITKSLIDIKSSVAVPRMLEPELLDPDENAEKSGPFNRVRGEGEFDNILGYSGYYLDRAIYQDGQWVSDWAERVYYSDANEIIAYSYGFEEDYLADIDGDGENELLCNCSSPDRSEKYLRIYKCDNGQILCGIINTQRCKEGTLVPKDERYETFFFAKDNTIGVSFPDYPAHTGKSWCGYTLKDGSCIEYSQWDYKNEPEIEASLMPVKPGNELTRFEKTEFTDILGFRGYYEDEISNFDEWTYRKYYAVLKDGTPHCIAISFGFEIDDNLVDIDGDGKEELLCNCTYGADCHEELYVYKCVDNPENPVESAVEKSIKVGFINWLKMDFEDLYYWGCNAVYTYYDKDSNEVEIRYCSTDENEAHHKKIKGNFNLIEYVNWGPEGGLPSIDQEKAYELYSRATDIKSSSQKTIISKL